MHVDMNVDAARVDACATFEWVGVFGVTKMGQAYMLRVRLSVHLCAPLRLFAGCDFEVVFYFPLWLFGGGVRDADHFGVQMAAAQDEFYVVVVRVFRCPDRDRWRSRVTGTGAAPPPPETR